MSIDRALHPAHVAILRALLFRPSARFTQLQKHSELTSDHFNFYLKQLIEDGYILKNNNGTYELTFKGKEFANRFDTETRTVERQPKIGVRLMISRSDGKLLVQQRLKQPFYGYWGRPGGKVGWGETILEAAARELLEETGLTAELLFESVYHKMDYNKLTGELLEDKIFFILTAINPSGTLIEEFEGGRNAWMTLEQYENQELTFGNNTQSKALYQQATRIPVVEVRHTYDPAHY